jgi:hypothetical protein
MSIEPILMLSKFHFFVLLGSGAIGRCFYSRNFAKPQRKFISVCIWLPGKIAESRVLSSYSVAPTARNTKRQYQEVWRTSEFSWHLIPIDFLPSNLD